MRKLVLLFALFSPFCLEAQSLFEYVGEPARVATASHLSEGAPLSRRIEVNPDILRYTSFSFPVGEGHEFAFRSEEIEERTPENFVSRFRVGSSEAVSTVTHLLGYTYGVVYVGNRVFEILPDGNGHVLREYSSMSFECGAEVLHTETNSLGIATTVTSTSRRRIVSRSPVSSSYEIDLAEGYMSASAVSVGGKAQIEAIIQNSVDVLNTAVRNSGITNVRFNLKGMREFNFDDSGDTTQILARLSSYQEFTDWRDSMGADLGGMWINRRGAAAYIPYGTSFGRAASYHISSPNLMGSPVALTFAHEVGHNMGMEHDRANANVNDPTATNYGWYDCMAGWATLMTYQNQVCRNVNVAEPIRIPYFSNPEVKYNGLATGIDKANNAGRLVFSSPYIASYVSPRN